ncbi:hypothetical protein K443DRAFT_132966 [Laccaria amethystina LaAM-08-1]|uniref:Uncharacterized protein n=1 Tax=Laccaria amethystina LaAM-08-1 TaxID=1095629 RepID=A0A0C9XPV8_9AGAR|nr:hypothetical protein K443DRAFT_132966 [Laccaria amethystina LaAM-08-1]
MGNTPRGTSPTPISSRTETFEAMRPHDRDKGDAHTETTQDPPTFRHSSFEQVLKDATVPGVYQSSKHSQQPPNGERVEIETELGEGSFVSMHQDERNNQPVPSDILTWAIAVVGGEEEVLPLAVSPFEKGNMGMTANEQFVNTLKTVFDASIVL